MAWFFHIFNFTQFGPEHALRVQQTQFYVETKIGSNYLDNFSKNHVGLYLSRLPVQSQEKMRNNLAASWSRTKHKCLSFLNKCYLNPIRASDISPMSSVPHGFIFPRKIGEFLCGSSLVSLNFGVICAKVLRGALRTSKSSHHSVTLKNK